MLKRLGWNTVPSSERLKRLNIWLAVLYAFQAVAVLVIGSSQSAPLTSSFLTVDTLASTTTGGLVLAPATHHLFDVNLLYLVFGVLLVLAAAHLAQAIWWRRRYESELKQNANVGRWAAYGFTATVLFVVLAILAGAYDITTLLILLVLGVVLHGACWCVERAVARRGRNRTDAWLGYGVAALAGLGMWLIVAVYLVGANVYGAGHIPARVYWLAGTTAVACLCVAFGLARQIQDPKLGQRYRLSEQRYLLLTLVISALLVWQIVAGTMH